MEQLNGENYFEETLRDLEPLPDELFRRAEDKKIMDAAINELPPLYREVLLLRFNSDFTFEEIGIILKKPLEYGKESASAGINQIEGNYRE